MERTSRLTAQLAYIYLALPFAIFSIGWMRWYFAVPAVLLLVLGLFFAIKDAPDLWQPEKSKKTLFTGAIMLAVIFFMVYLSGIGRFAYQNPDHLWRNALYDALREYSWPVYEVNEAGNTVSLVYYIGFWLPSALVGKVLGETAGYTFMALWAVLGIAIFWSLVCSKMKKFTIWPLLLFFAFSGLDLAVHYFRDANMAAIGATAHLEWGFETFQFSSFTTQLFWVFNQAIPAWILTMLILLQKNNRTIVFLLALAMLNCTLPFVGMLPIAALVVFTRKYEGVDSRKAWWKTWFKDTFTLPNILCGGTVGIMSFMYVLSNSRSADSGSKVSDGTFGFVWQSYDHYQEFLMSYLLFIACEALIYFFLIAKYQKSHKLFWVAGITLAVVPLFTMGIAYDFCMRVSIPALLVLYLMVEETLEMAYNKKDYSILIPLCICLLIGAKTPLNEVTRSISKTTIGHTWAGTFELMKSEDDQNFVAEVEDSFFYRYIAKK